MNRRTMLTGAGLGFASMGFVGVLAAISQGVFVKDVASLAALVPSRDLSVLSSGQPHLLSFSPEEILAFGDEVLFVDIRTAPEWHETGVLPNARLHTFQGEVSFLEDLQRLSAENPRPVVLICRSDNRTTQAARLLAPHLDVPVISVNRGVLAVLRENPSSMASVARQEQCLVC